MATPTACKLKGFFYFMEKILCYQKHEVDVILENEFFTGGLCYECNYQVITNSLRDECIHDVRTIGINRRNNSIEFRDLCIKCFTKIKTYKKSDFTSYELSRIPVRNIDVIDQERAKYYEIRRVNYSEITNLLNEKREELINLINEERAILRNEYYQSLEWKKLRLIVLNRDKYICQGCLKNQATEVHHLTYDNIYNELLFQLISVCKPCHNIIHNSND